MKVDFGHYLRSDGLWAPLPQGWHRYNSIRNPAMNIVQRATGSSTGGGTVYVVDGWFGASAGSQGFSISSIAVNIPPDPNGWYPHVQYAQRWTTTTANASLSASSYNTILQSVESFMADPLHGVPTSVSLLARSSIAGTFAIAIRDSTTTYSIVYDCVIPVANVWTLIQISDIPAFPAAGSFPVGTNALGYYMGIHLGAGSTYRTSTTGQWVAGNYISTPNTTNFTAVNSTTFDFTAFKHEPNPVNTPFVPREYEDEWNLNARYLQYLDNYVGIALSVNWTYNFGLVCLPVPMRYGAPDISEITFNYGGTPALWTASPCFLNFYNSSGTGWVVGNFIVVNGLVSAEF